MRKIAVAAIVVFLTACPRQKPVATSSHTTTTGQIHNYSPDAVANFMNGCTAG